MSNQKQPGQCQNCRVDITLNGLCYACTEKIKEAHNQLRAQLSMIKSELALSSKSDDEPPLAIIQRMSSQLTTATQRAEKAVDDADNEWLDSIGIGWKRLTGKPWDVLDGETREEGLSANVGQLLAEIELRDQTIAQLRAQLAAEHSLAVERLSQLTAATQRAEKAERERDYNRTQLELHKREMAQLRADKAKAEAACAEKDAAIDRKIQGKSAYAYLCEQFPAVVGHIPMRDYFTGLGNAMADPCGHGRVSPEELRPTIECLERIFNHASHPDTESNFICNVACDELARLQKLTS